MAKQPLLLVFLLFSTGGCGKICNTPCRERKRDRMCRRVICGVLALVLLIGLLLTAVVAAPRAFRSVTTKAEPLKDLVLFLGTNAGSAIDRLPTPVECGVILFRRLVAAVAGP